MPEDDIRPIVAVDFDGTIVMHDYPDIKQAVPFAIECLKMMQQSDNGARLILYTMRSGKELEAAIEYCKDKGIEFWGINENPEQKSWTTSPKIYANFYIDDAAAGTPLFRKGHKRPYVNWFKIGDILTEYGIFIETIKPK